MTAPTTKRPVGSGLKVDHCQQLMGVRIRESDRSASLKDMTTRLSRRLPDALGSILAGAKLRVSVSDPKKLSAGEATDLGATYFAGCEIAQGPDDIRFAVLIGKADILRVTDRLFGGNGELPDPLPEELPMTADLVLSRLEQALCEALAPTYTVGELPMIVKRARDHARMLPDADGESWTLVDFAVNEEESESWNIAFAIRDSILDRLARSRTKGGVTPKRKAISRDPEGAPYADIPFDITATLLELMVPFARLSDLKVGDRLPVAIPREVDLVLGKHAVAAGSIGTNEDRIALRLSHVS